MLFIIKFANQIMSKNQITFVYQSGRKDRLNSKGAFPQEFFYGFEYFKNVFDKYKIIEFNNKEFKNIRSLISLFLEKVSGLPFFISIKKKLSYNDSISLLFLKYLSLDYDSHLLRKYGIEKASKITKKASMIRKINNNKNLCIALKKFDKYLKFFNFNPGTCADLTVTTLLINKIRDIFKFRI